VARDRGVGPHGRDTPRQPPASRLGAVLEKCGQVPNALTASGLALLHVGQLRLGVFELVFSLLELGLNELGTARPPQLRDESQDLTAQVVYSRSAGGELGGSRSGDDVAAVDREDGPKHMILERFRAGVGADRAPPMPWCLLQMYVRKPRAL
jgi:hypothetical protein